MGQKYERLTAEEKHANILARRARLLATNPSEYKECCRCHVIRPKTEFFLSRVTTGGHENTCKKCRAEDVRRKRAGLPPLPKPTEDGQRVKDELFSLLPVPEYTGPKLNPVREAQQGRLRAGQPLYVRNTP